MLSERLDEIAQAPGAPFLAAQTSRGLFVRTAEVTALNALVADGGVTRGLGALFAEAERVARDGFTATELERQKLNSQRYLEQALHRERQESVGARWPTSSSATSCRTNRFRASSTSTACTSGSSRGSRWPKSTPRQDLDAGWQPRRRWSVRPNEPGSALPTEATLAAVIKEAGEPNADGVRRSRQHDSRCSSRCRHRARSRRTSTKTPTRRHRVAAVERRASRAQADDLQGGRDSVPRHRARAARRSRATRTSSRRETADDVIGAGRPRRR